MTTTINLIAGSIILGAMALGLAVEPLLQAVGL